MNQQSAVFDAVKYKDTTRKQWDGAAAAWDRYGPLLSRWLGPATELMLDMTKVGKGARVLDVAAGAGEQTLVAAQRVGPEGFVLATDISPEILRFAATNAKLNGLRNIDTVVADGELLEIGEQAPFDAVISRVGLIYFPDQHRALSAMRGHLRQNGRVGAIVYSTADKNTFFSLPVGIIRRRAGLGAPLPGQPGPFSLGDPALLSKRLTEAGFHDVQIEKVSAPVRLKSASECLQFEQESFGALHQMLASLTAKEQDEAWDEIEEALGQFETDGQFTGPCEMLVVAGTR
jgi:SAM-dependent methyltransferase